MTWTWLRCTAPALLLALLLLAPFYDKAFTIDDTLFLLQAQQLRTDPLHATAFAVVWTEAPAPQRMSQIMPSGPVMAWLLLPCVMAGGREWVAHAVQFLMLALALAATVGLGLRLGLAPRLATLAGVLLAATPVVLGMAATAMPDIPAMALGVAGLERCVAWKQERRWSQAVLAVLVLGLAPLARPHLLLLLPVAACLAVADPFSIRAWRTVSWRFWFPLPAALLFCGLLVLLTRDPQGQGTDLAFSARLLSSVHNVPANLVAFATHWVFLLPLAIPLLLSCPRAMARRWWLFLLVTLAALPLAQAAPGGRWRLLIAPVAGLGVVAVWHAIADAWRRRDGVEFALALVLLTPLLVAVYLHLPGKYLLIAAPAVALLTAQALGRLTVPTRRTVAGVTIILGITLGLAIVRADAAFAALARRAAAELIAPQVATGKHVWYAGHWGFHWYAMQAGARPLTITPPFPGQGDLAVSSQRAGGYAIALYPQRSLLKQLADVSPGGRIMCQELGAGFFSNAWGYLPWAWGSAPTDVYALWRLDQVQPSWPPDSR